jgi:hypothetical protein
MITITMTRHFNPRTRSIASLPHSKHLGVADEVFLQFGIDRALAAQIGNRALGVATQFPVWKFIRFCFLGRHVAFDADLDQFGPRVDAGIHAARGDEFSLGLRVGVKTLRSDAPTIFSN